jgi:hypothetical protein
MFVTGGPICLGRVELVSSVLGTAHDRAAGGWKVERMNNYGCSLVWGQPQGPTGGGIGLFRRCAAGDSAMAVVLEIREAAP